MSRRTFRIEPLSVYDHTGIEKRLADMARKGWLLERIVPMAWVYRRIEPRELHFSVTYYPKASEFDPEPSEGQRTFRSSAPTPAGNWPAPRRRCRFFIMSGKTRYLSTPIRPWRWRPSTKP